MQTKEVKQTKQQTALMGGLSRLRSALVLYTVVVSTLAPAQNLVPNGSFEEYTQCPDYFGEVPNCVGWHQYVANSADYFNACATHPAATVPQSWMGYQEAAEGQAYVGMTTWLVGVDYYREVIGAALSEPLQPGVPVRLCFQGSPGGFGSNPVNSADHAGSNIGLRFYTTQPADWSYQNVPYPNDAALYLPELLDDTSAWVSVSGIYVPDSAYTWVLIGNFFDDQHSPISVLDPQNPTGFAYAFVDNVSVSYDLSYCGSVGLLENKATEAVWVSNPFDDRLRVVLDAPARSPFHLALYDGSGRQVLRFAVPLGQQVVEVPTEFLTSGAYVLTGAIGHDLFPPQRVVHLKN